MTELRIKVIKSFVFEAKYIKYCLLILYLPMQQRTITISNIQIAYLIKNEFVENTIFFIHGNSVSSRSWKKQLDSELLSKYRLIAFDLPAHGDSGASANPEQDYSLPGLGLIIANAIKALAGNDAYILVGLSLGTNILAEALAFDLKPSGIVLAGSCIVGGKYTIESFVKPDTNVHVVFTEQSPEAEVKKYTSEVMFNPDEIDIEEFISDYYRVKPSFRSCLNASLQLQNYSDQIALIQKINKPILLIFGKDEKIVNPDYLDDAPLNLWHNTVFKLSSASHLVHTDQANEFNLLLANYAKDVLDL